MKLENKDILVSFDVKSWFQVSDVFYIIKERLQADETIVEGTSFTVAQICELIELFLRSTYFQHGEAKYEQTDGMAWAHHFHL